MFHPEIFSLLVSQVQFDTDDTFEDSFLNDYISETIGRVKNNYLFTIEYIWDFVKVINNNNFDVDNALRNLYKFAFTVSEMLWVLVFDVTDRSDAFTIFETINTTGINLAPSDVVKFHLITNSNNKQKIFEFWNKLVQTIGDIEGISLNEFCYYHFLSLFPSNARKLKQNYGAILGKIIEEEIFYKIKFNDGQKKPILISEEDLDNSKTYSSKEDLNTPDKRVMAYVEDMLHIAEMLQKAKEFNMGSEYEEVFRSLFYYLKYDNILPAVFRVFSYEVDFELIDYYQFLVSFLINEVIIMGRSKTDLLNSAKELATLLRVHDISEFGEKLEQLKPFSEIEENNYVHALQTKEFKDVKKSYFILRSVDMFQNSNTADLAESKFIIKHHGENYKIQKDGAEKTIIPTLEHIFPKRAKKSEWEEMYNDAKTNNVSISRLINNIGNHAILEKYDNNKIGNKPFSEKKEVFKNAGIPLTEELGNLSEFTLKHIEERAIKIAKTAFNIWEYDQVLSKLKSKKNNSGGS